MVQPRNAATLGSTPLTAAEPVRAAHTGRRQRLAVQWRGWLLVLGLLAACLAPGCGKSTAPAAAPAAPTSDATALATAPTATAAELADAPSPVALSNPVTAGVAGVLRRQLPLQADAGHAAIVPWGDAWMLAWCAQGEARRALVSNTALHTLALPAKTSCTQHMAAGGGRVWWLGATDGKPTLLRAQVSSGTPLFAAVALPEGLTVTASSQLRVDHDGRAWWAMARSAGGGVLGSAGPDAERSDSRDAGGDVVAVAALGGQEALSVVLQRAPDGTAQAQLTRWRPDLTPVWQRPWDVRSLRRLGQPLALAATAQQWFGGRGVGAGLLLETDSDWQLTQISANGQVDGSTRIPRSREAAQLLSLPDGAWLVLQSRTGGMWLQRIVWRGTAVERAVRFGWLGDEQVLAAGHNAHVLSLLSRDGTSGELVVSAMETARLSDVAPRAPPKNPAECRDAEPCDIEVEFGAGVCGSWPLSDGQACGVGLACRQGHCRAP